MATVTIQVGHHEGETAQVLSTDRDGGHEVRLADGSINYFDSWEVR